MTKEFRLFLYKSLIFLVYPLAFFIFVSCTTNIEESTLIETERLDEINKFTSTSEISSFPEIITTTLAPDVPIMEIPPTVTKKPSSTLAPPTATGIITPSRIVTKIVPDALRKYIGLRYSELPDGLVSGFGMLIVPSTKGDYTLDGVHSSQLHMLWFGKSIRWLSEGKDQKGWEVLDILELKPLEGEDEVLIPSGCMIDQKLDPEIIVIGREDDEAYRTRYITNDKVLRAWRLNRALEVIEEINIGNIECYADMAMDWK